MGRKKESSLESFFDVGREAVDITAHYDDLSWENISGSGMEIDARGNKASKKAERKRAKKAAREAAKIAASQARRNACFKNRDCASGFVCVDGDCVQKNRKSGRTGGGKSRGSRAGDNCGGTPLGPDGQALLDCFSQDCAELPKCGDQTIKPGTKPKKITDPKDLECCAGKKYGCPDPDTGVTYYQCFPCFDLVIPDPMDPKFPDFPPLEPLPPLDPLEPLPPLDLEEVAPDVPILPDIDPETGQPFQGGPPCSSYCDNYKRQFNRVGPNCEGARVCSNCSICLANSRCEALDGNNGYDTPCYCLPVGEACRDCETCDAQTGECVDSPENCVRECDCVKPCPPGKNPTTGGLIARDVTYHHTQHYLDKTGAPPVPCGEECRAIHAGLDTCPPLPEEPDEEGCGKSNSKCLDECRCTTFRAPCSATEAPCPDGYVCEPRGVMFANTASGECSDILGGKTFFVKMCKVVPPGERADGSEESCGDCSADSDCGDCEICVNGFCEADDDCDDVPCEGEPCGVPGNYSDCCGEDQRCVQMCEYLIKENCHSVPYSVYAPCDGLTFEHVESINAKDAVCHRYHTHARVYDSIGNYLAYHLDAQAGYSLVGKAPGSFKCVPK